MATTDTPTWLNLDVFDIPQEAIDNVQSIIKELRDLVPVLEDLGRRAREAETDAEARMAQGSGDDLPEDVYFAIREATGHAEMHDLLLLIGWHAEGGDSILTEQGRKEILDRRGL